jgi:hypothetical protein
VIVGLPGADTGDIKPVFKPIVTVPSLLLQVPPPDALFKVMASPPIAHNGTLLAIDRGVGLTVAVIVVLHPEPAPFE